MAFRHHAEECVYCLWYLIFRTGYGDNVTGLFSVRKVNLAVPFLLQILDFRQPADQFAVIETIYDYRLGDKLGILNRFI